VTEDTPVQQVADMMIKNRIHRVFVTRGEKVVVSFRQACMN
jgi:CBS domain-containing protein